MFNKFQCRHSVVQGTTNQGHIRPTGTEKGPTWKERPSAWMKLAIERRLHREIINIKIFIQKWILQKY